MKKIFSITLIIFSFLFILSNAIAGTLILESWRNDDADAWNEKIIPAFNAKSAFITPTF